MTRKPRQPSVTVGLEWHQPGPHYRIPLPADYLPNIGEIIVQWANLEREIDLWLSHLKSHPLNGGTYSPQLGPFRSRAKEAKTLAANIFSDKAVLSRFRAAIDAATRLSPLRDLIAHGAWQPSSDKRFNVHLIRFTDPPEMKAGLFTADKLRKLAQQIAKVNYDIFLFNIRDWPSPPIVRGKAPLPSRRKARHQ